MNPNLNEIKRQSEFNSDQINLNSFNDLLANSEEANKFIDIYKERLKEYFTINSTQYNRLNELYDNFSSESSGQLFINTPIHKIESIIKNMFQIQLKIYEVIISKGSIFVSIDNELDKIKKIILDSSSKLKNLSYNNEMITATNKVFNSMMKSMSELEIQEIDEYIWEKYKKHVLEAKEVKPVDMVAFIKILEKNIYDFVLEKKSSFVSDLKETEKKIQIVFNKMQENFRNYFSYLKDLNNTLSEQFEQIEKEINTEKVIEDIQKNEKNTNPKSNLILDEKDLYTVKYKIKIIKNNKIVLKKDQKEIKEEIKNNKEQKLNSFKEKYLFLTEEDKYQIISKLYSYDLKILDKSQYVLDVEQGKIIASDLSKEILLYNEDDENTKNKLNEKYEEIIESMNNKIVNNLKNIESFFLVLNNYRAQGKVKLIEKFYDLVIYVYNKAQDLLIKTNNKKLEDLMLILSRTYYKEISGKKIYVVEAIKSHELYKNMDFWKAIVIKQIEDEFKVMRNFNSTNNTTNILTQKKKESIIYTKLIPFADLLKDFEFKNDTIIEIINQILDKYKYDKASREQIFSFINES
jgi:gamma-glutamylcyclotransferase (GGCT)/AIG2-like uncharacterized protein YtfP